MTTFTEETLVEGYAKATFSDYTPLPAKVGEVNGQAVVTMTISLIQLPEQELTIKPSAVLVVEEYDEYFDYKVIGVPGEFLTKEMWLNAGSPSKVIVAKDVRVIDGWAFNHNSILTDIIIPNGVINIGDECFALCTSISSITLPNSLIYVGLDAFYNCTSLKEIVLEAHTDVTEVGQHNATLPTIQGHTWKLYVGDSETGAVVANNSNIQYFNVKYTYKAEPNA